MVWQCVAFAAMKVTPSDSYKQCCDYEKCDVWQLQSNGLGTSGIPSEHCIVCVAQNHFTSNFLMFYLLLMLISVMHLILIACYHLTQFSLKRGSVLTECIGFHQSKQSKWMGSPRSQFHSNTCFGTSFKYSCIHHSTLQCPIHSSNFCAHLYRSSSLIYAVYVCYHLDCSSFPCK